MSDVVFVVVNITDHNRQRVCPTNGRMSTVLHDYRQVIFLLLLPVKLLQADYYSAAISILTTTLEHKHSITAQL